MIATLDPSTAGPGIVFSGSNLTATSNNSGWQSARATLPQSTGKYYCEVLIVTADDGFGMGLCNASTNLNGVLGADTTSIFEYARAGGAGVRGAIFYNGGDVGSIGTPVFGSGDVIAMAVDLSAELVWFYNPQSAQWNGDVLANQNPATGTGGISVSTIGTPCYPAVCVSVPSDAVAIRMLAGSFVHPIPSGYTAWSPISATGNQSTAKVGSASATVTLSLTGVQASGRAGAVSPTWSIGGNRSTATVGTVVPTRNELVGTRSLARGGSVGSARVVAVVGVAGSTHVRSTVPQHAVTGIGVQGVGGAHGLAASVSANITRIYARSTAGYVNFSRILVVSRASATGRVSPLAASHRVATAGVLALVRQGALNRGTGALLVTNKGTTEVGLPVAARALALSGTRGHASASSMATPGLGARLMAVPATGVIGSVQPTQGVAGVSSIARAGGMGAIRAIALVGCRGVTQIGKVRAGSPGKQVAIVTRSEDYLAIITPK